MRYDTVESSYADEGVMAQENRMPIRRECERLGEAIDKAQAMLAQLEDRMGFVLGPDAPRPTDSNEMNKRPEMGSPLLSQLQERNDAVRNLQSRLSALIQRIEV